MVPARMCEIMLPSPRKPTGVTPDRMPLMVSPPPLNGTRTRSAPVSRFHFSMNTINEDDGAE